uniref:DMT family transporter n=1 Tax=Victivallis vadensis TaxID=172901 RepID=UPI00266C5F55
MKIAELAVVAVLSVLAGCTGGPAGSRENWRKPSPYLPNPDLKKLSGISVLPEKPTDRQISEYLAEIEEASRGQRVFGSQDPQVDLLRRVGPGHLKLLIPYLDRKISSYLCWALPALVGEEEKELVISLLPEREEFLGIVVDRGWAEEARSEIVQLLKNDRLTLMKIIGCILGFGGIIAINFGGTVSTDTWFGDMMILFSTISAAAGNIIAKKVTTGRDPFPVTAFQLLTGGFILLVSGICCGGSIGLINVESVSVLLWLAFVSAAAFSLWTALLKFHDASRISVFNLLVPVFGTVLSGLMLGENVFRIETLISLILISLGIA